MKNIWVLLCVTLFILSCATAEKGRVFDTSKANQIEIGKTTETEIIAMLGSPYRTKINEDGEKLFLYAHGIGKVRGVTATSKIEKLQILFNKKGVVKAIDKAGI